jgi:hypothetical protein
MSIHIYKNRKAIDSLFIITDEVYNALRIPIEILEKKTGIFIDDCGDTRLSHQHTMLLLQLIQIEIIKPAKPLMDFMEFLEKMINGKTDLELIGE